MGQATLMYGIGATKAGTSWLYRYLESHPQCVMPPVKELHYFDTLRPEALEWQLDQLVANVIEQDGEDENVRIAGGLRYQRFESLGDMLTSPRDGHKAYLDYLYANAGDARLVGDITPSYSLLDDVTVAEMAKTAEKTKFVFLMRDPVARMWSNIRTASRAMVRTRKGFRRVADRMLETVLSQHDHRIMQRSDYKSVLERLDRVLPASDRIALFFEDLFSENTIRKLCDFLGLSFHPAEMAVRVNEGPPLRMSQEQQRLAQSGLREQYEAVAQRFGHLPEAWQRNMVGV